MKFRDGSAAVIGDEGPATTAQACGKGGNSVDPKVRRPAEVLTTVRLMVKGADDEESSRLFVSWLLGCFL